MAGTADSALYLDSSPEMLCNPPKFIFLHSQGHGKACAPTCTQCLPQVFHHFFLAIEIWQTFDSLYYLHSFNFTFIGTSHLGHDGTSQYSLCI